MLFDAQKKLKKNKKQKERNGSLVAELVKIKLHVIFPHHCDKGFLCCWTTYIRHLYF